MTALLPNRMEYLIRELNSPLNQGVPERVDAIQKEIQHLQREPSAWQLGLDLLNHDEALIRFYGALTLTIKVNADWEKDIPQEDRNLVNQLIENLLIAYIKLCALPDADYVLSKLSGTLSAVFEKQNAAWAFPCRHLLACMLTGRYITQHEIPTMADMLDTDGSLSSDQLRAVLRLALSITEELGQTSAVTKGQNLNVRLSNNATDIWLLIDFCTTHFCKEAGIEPTNTARYNLGLNGTAAQLTNNLKLVIQLIPYWTSFVKVESPDSIQKDTISHFQLFRQSVSSLLQIFDHQPVAQSLLHMVTTLETENHRLLQRAVPDYCERVINSSSAISWMESLLAGHFHSEASSYSDFLDAVIGQIDPTSPDYLQNPQYVAVLRQTQKLLRCEGVAVVEDNVCRVALEVMSTVAEGFSDWPEPSPYDVSLRELILETCSACMFKIRIPEEELDIETHSWDEDERAMFEDFRYDVQDFLQIAFASLGTSLVQRIAQTIVHLDFPMEWNTFEAGVFALMALSDALASDPQKYDPFTLAVMDSNLWKQYTSQNAKAPGRVGQTIIKFLGENTAFLQRHPDNLVHNLDFLFGSLHLQMVSGPASRTIYTLCDSQRSFLTRALPQFLGSLNTIVDLTGNAKYRIYSAVSAIVQSLPSEAAKVEPLSQILSLIEAEVQNLSDLNEDYVELVSRSTEIIQTLAAVGKGLRSPAESVVDLEISHHSDRLFWVQGEGVPLQQRALGVFSKAFNCFDIEKDAELVSASCDFLRSGFTEEHPSPFKFVPEVSIELLSRLIEIDNPNLDATMSTASSYLASASLADSNNGFETLLSNVVGLCQNVNAMLADPDITLSMIDVPTSALDFCARMLPKWGQVWFSMNAAIQSASIVVDFALALLRDTDTLPRRVAASFFAALFEVSGPGSPLTMNEAAASNIKSLLDHYAPRVLGLTLHLLGGECARSEVEAVTEPLRKFIARHPMRAKAILRDAMQADSGVLSQTALDATKPEQRNRFVAQVETLRGSRKTSEVTKDFWIRCKGNSFRYTTV